MSQEMPSGKKPGQEKAEWFAKQYGYKAVELPKGEESVEMWNENGTVKYKESAWCFKNKPLYELRDKNRQVKVIIYEASDGTVEHATLKNVDGEDRWCRDDD
jgi:hypothetical protein